VDEFLPENKFYNILTADYNQVLEHILNPMKCKFKNILKLMIYNAKREKNLVQNNTCEQLNFI